MANCDNTRPCPCTYPCPRHGKCCECVAYHRDKEGGVPGCFFSKEGEATWDRSVEALWREYRQGALPLDPSRDSAPAPRRGCHPRTPRFIK